MWLGYCARLSLVGDLGDDAFEHAALAFDLEGIQDAFVDERVRVLRLVVGNRASAPVGFGGVMVYDAAVRAESGSQRGYGRWRWGQRGAPTTVEVGRGSP